VVLRLLQEEWRYRQERSLAYRLDQAKLPWQWSLESFPFDELYASLADRSTSRLRNRLARYDILLIDELGYLTPKPEQVNAFFKLMDLRYATNPSMITTNLDYPDWSEHRRTSDCRSETDLPCLATIPNRVTWFSDKRPNTANVAAMKPPGHCK
jgi:DNA replication protein DnaC